MNKTRRDRLRKVIDILADMRGEIEDICGDEGFVMEGCNTIFAYHLSDSAFMLKFC